MSNYDQAIELLKGNSLENLSALKFLTSFRDQSDVEVIQENHEWLAISRFPSSLFSYDRKYYPEAEQIVLINGSEGILKMSYKNYLPSGCFVVKTAIPEIQADLMQHYYVKEGKTILSFTADKILKESPVSGFEISHNEQLSEPVIGLLTTNYSRDELVSYFDNGARNYLIRKQGLIACGCFVFQNFENIREIAGLHTLPDYQRNGLAKWIVSKAVNDLIIQKFIPRYAVESGNTASIQLAQSVGLRKFMELRHWVVYR